MRILNPVVFAQTPRPVPRYASQIPQRSRIGEQAVSHDLVRHVALALQQFPQKFQGCSLVPALLHQDVQDLTLLVDGSPHEHPFAIDAHDHLVEMPDGVSLSALATNVGGDGRTELVRPAANRLVAHIDPAFGEHFLNIAQARGEAEIEPNRQPDRIGRKPMALEGYGVHLVPLRDEWPQAETS